MNMLPITVADSGSSSATGLGGQTIVTGNPTVGSVVSLPCSSADTAVVQAINLTSSTIVIEISPDGGLTWYLSTVLPIGETTSVVSLTTIGAGLVALPGCYNVRARCTSFGADSPMIGLALACWSLPFASSTLPLLSGNYSPENGTDLYVAENGTDQYVTET